MRTLTKTLVLVLVILTVSLSAQNLTYPIVDTDQTLFFSSSAAIAEPAEGDTYYGQDAHYDGLQPSYTNNGDGTVTDNNTGLMWQQGLYDLKYTYDESFIVADTATIGGYDDWRVPTIKELYSLILFSGRTGMHESEAIPYIDTGYFEFRFGTEYDASARYIDAQYVTATAYVNTVMNGRDGVFGVNFADGRIKGYPQNNSFEVKLVRGNPEYGINNFINNEDGTVTDAATGLMWDQQGSAEGMNWEDALTYVQDLNEQNYSGYSDWRLPNPKELQSIVDYTRSPGTTNSAAIDPVFEVPVITDEGGWDNYPFYWTGTTHDDGPYAEQAAYVAFGEALGFMQFPSDAGLTLYDVHGAGAQRSDPKSGNPDNFPEGRGPQGDVIRINNYVRAVRDAELVTGIEDEIGEAVPHEFKLEQNYPNPFNPATTINYTLSTPDEVTLKVYNILGSEVATLVDSEQGAGTYSVKFDAAGLSSGVYFYTLTAGSVVNTKKMVLMK